MPRLKIDLNSTTPVYEQISSGLRALLVSGELKAGDPLPTVRELAVNLGVHHNTVAEAYRILAAEGWLDLRRGRGALALNRPKPAPDPNAMPNFERQVQGLLAKAIAGGLSEENLAHALEDAAGKLRQGGKL